MKVKSLRRRLVRDLLYLQLLISMLVTATFFALAWAKDGLIDKFGEEATEIVQEALDRQADGRLMLNESKELTDLLRHNPGFWLVVRDVAGIDELTRGSVPAEFMKLATTLDGTKLALVGEHGRGGEVKPRAQFRRLESKAGTVNVLLKTGATTSFRTIMQSILWITIFLVAPMAILSSLVVIFAVPWMVRHELLGLVTTASLADRVDVHDRTTRLPLDGLAEEILPLVHAVNRAFDRLNDGYAQQERFLVDAAHELRTPITVLQVRLDGLPDGGLKPKLLHDVARLGTLAEQLLDLQRLHNTPASLVGQVDLKELSERMGADLAPLAILHDCVVSVDAPLSVPALGDTPSLERAIANLIQNAIEHGGEGCEIQVRAYPPSTIEVNDSGPGIPESQRKHVLAPFHRLAPRGRGAGLGLHLVTEVVKLHRGRLTIGTSELGGASIRIDLNLS